MRILSAAAFCLWLVPHSLPAAETAALFPEFTAGAGEVSFTEPSPLSAEAGKRLNLKFPPRPYDIAKEKFKLFVPKDYSHDAPWGLFVYIDAGDGGGPPGHLNDMLNEKRLIGIGPVGAGNNRDTHDRIRLAVDAVFNMKKRFNIHPKRIYVSGYSGGGRASSEAAVAYADVFSGGVFFCGCNHFKLLRTPKGVLAAAYNPPVPLIDLARRNSRLVFLTGEKDMNHQDTQDVHGAFKAEGFTAIKLIDVPGMGHEAPPPDWFAKAADFLDGDEGAVEAAAKDIAAGKPAAVAAALGKLAGVRTAKAGDLALEQLKKDDAPDNVRKAAIACLGSQGVGAEAVVPYLTNKNAALRTAAETAVRSMGPSAVPSLFNGLASEDAEMRTACHKAATAANKYAKAKPAEFWKTGSDEDRKAALEAWTESWKKSRP